MKKLACTLFLLFTMAAAAQSSGAPPPRLDVPKGMKQYFVGLFVRGENRPKISETEQQQLLQRHLAYIRSQAEKGKYRLAGPFLDDGAFAGILIIDTATAEEAKNIVDHDPMVLAGRLAIQIHPVMLADVSCVLIEYEEHGGK